MKHQRQSISGQKITWINIVGANREDTKYLRNKFKFDEADLDDALAHSHAQRPKVIFRPHYVFAVFLFPVYSKKTRKVSHAEVDLFVTKDHIITIHYDVTHNLNEFFEHLTKERAIRDSYLNDIPSLFLYELLKQIYAKKYEILDVFSKDIDFVEQNIYREREREMVREILLLKRNVVMFKKAMLTHQNILEQLRDFKGTYWSGTPDVRMAYEKLLRRVNELWTTLNNYYETINALEDTNSALVTFKLNDIMRTLTIFSVIVFPLTLLAAIFGMNTKYIPIVGSQHDFWIIIGIMAVGSGAMFYYFKKKKWI